MDAKTLDEIVTALSKIVERLNNNEIRLRSLEESTTTALKRLNTFEDELKRVSKGWGSRLDEIDQKVETLGVKYIELARASEKLTVLSQSTAQRQDVERLRTLVEVLR
jgi:ABC-type transporter Mla subunit MlaD